MAKIVPLFCSSLQNLTNQNDLKSRRKETRIQKRTCLAQNSTLCRNQALKITFNSLFSPFSILFVFVFLCQASSTSAQLPKKNVELDRCHPNRTEERRICEKGIILPLWPPGDTSLLTGADTAGRAIVFLITLVYLFLGVSIVADRFMASIEVITSKEKEVVYKNRNGEDVTTTVRIWNETVSNLTLMALGSSAPEIMLSVIEICGKGFYAGDLGPSTIVGSASFNLFIIIAICMYVIPDDEIRKVKHPRVFFVTATWSILAYIWLYIIIAVISEGIVEIWEGIVTFLFFPILVVIAWIADRRLLVYKFMYKRYRTRNKKVIVEHEGSPDSRHEDGRCDGDGALHLTELGENGGPVSDDNVVADDVYIDNDVGEIIDPESNRRSMIKLMRELRKKHPEADMAELARLASSEALEHQPKSRAFYRIQATRKMTGAGNILHKGKAEHMKSTESLDNVQDQDDAVAKILFDPPDYRVLENCGFAELFVVRKGGDLNTTLYVDYRTEEGTANAGSDFEYAEDTIVFKPGETVGTIKIRILDDDIFEEDEYFTVHLSNVRSGSPDGMFDTNVNSDQIAKLEPPAMAKVTILDDDHAGVFSFIEESVTVNEGVGILKVEVQRNSGARGKVIVPYRTVNGTAKGGGEDFIDAIGELEFDNDETTQFINVQIVDDEEYEKNKSFLLELSQPKLTDERPSYDSGTDVGSDSGINQNKPLTQEEEEEKRIAELGKPRLGEHQSIEIIIEESYEFKNTVDKLIKKANLAVIVGTSSWREQFVEALSVNGGDDEDEDGTEANPTCFDYVMHFLTVFWKILFAFVPPTDYFDGWACFSVSIIMIGLLTAVIGDVASQFGCIVNLNDAVTAVTLVAMGTSVPDTFASKVAAVGDQYADASIGNVTGSNAVNVFLGIGIAWTIAAIYWAVTGREPAERVFRVEPGNLAFSVTVFSVFAIIAIIVLMIRRKSKRIGGELGGPRTLKIISAAIFVMLWVVYILLAALDSYCVIKTF